ncbi:uncharacterized protein SAPINGB_P005192 [Magnusiomyces paraingens]|uniref:Fluoride ion transporter CrcB n=1 Tax=Magnusiomyces paraingens TaxID=2606893 RepID=A0A5E8BZV2_9ASCO|nr:uncharacterized protein SAPINGB_P005192 [Saprochaete ingens]VVT56642.1 unnamed protein product [Saprochaete ingens]
MKTFLDFLELHLNFVFFGQIGLLTRLGLELLCQHQGPFTGVLFSNFFGCQFMGFVVNYRLLREPDKDDSEKLAKIPKKVDTPLHNAFTTGYAGSVTTFSSFILETFTYASNITSNQKMPYPDSGWGIPMAMAYIVVTAGVSFTGFYFGKHLAYIAQDGLSAATFFPPAPEITDQNQIIVPSTNPYLRKRHSKPFFPGLTVSQLLIVQHTFSIMGALFLAATFSLAIATTTVPEHVFHSSRLSPLWRYYTLALIFSPIAVTLRYWLIRLLNPLFFLRSDRFFVYNIQCSEIEPHSLSAPATIFPVGTFICNIFAVLVLSSLVLVQRGASPSSPIGEKLPIGGVVHGAVRCDVVRALADGFCGSLSTISTFVNELMGMNVMRAYIYGTISVSVGLASVVLILGSYIWTNGMANACFQ